MRPRPNAPVRIKRPETPEKLFTQVIEAAKPQLLKLWEQGDKYFPKTGTRCEQEIQHQTNVGRSYYQCNPHFWQCFWQGGVVDNPSLKIDLFGQTFHLVARPSFANISAFSPSQRFYEFYRRAEPGNELQYGYAVDVEIKEIPGLSQPMILSDSCRDTYLPQRIYGYSQVKDKREDGFVWDNFGRNIFVDRFYVSNRQLNEWRIANREFEKIIPDRKEWPSPALIDLPEQISYCAFLGKRLLEAKLFDAASMTPSDVKDLWPAKVFRPDTHWQRDLGKTFIGMAKINPDYQLTPLDCQLAQVEGCQDKFFSTDSATWMGFHFSLGFYPESLQNFIQPDKNLKMSSRFLPPDSDWHQLGILSSWKGKQTKKLPVAFRCYEEVSP